MAIPKMPKSGEPFGDLRRKAQERLIRLPDDAAVVNGFSAEETRNLIHELRVHQIELEMQNEELLHTRQELERARDRYADLYDFAPVAYLSLDRNHRVLESNLACADLLGTKRPALLRHTFPQYVAREDRDAFHRFIAGVFEQGGRRGCELRLQREGGAFFPAQLEAVAPHDDGETSRQCRVVVLDISERKRVETELRLAATVFDTSDEGMMITGPDARIQRVNRAFTAVTGYTEEEVVGSNPRLLASGRHDQAFYSLLWETLRTTGAWQGEIWNRRKNGEIYTEWLRIRTITDSRGEAAHYVGIFSDTAKATPPGRGTGEPAAPDS